MCLLASRNRFLTERGSGQSNVLRPAGFHKLTVLELEESVVLSYVYGDTRFPPAHCLVACGARVVWLARRQWVDSTSNCAQLRGMLRFSVQTTCSCGPADLFLVALAIFSNAHPLTTAHRHVQSPRSDLIHPSFSHCRQIKSSRKITLPPPPRTRHNPCRARPPFSSTVSGFQRASSSRVRQRTHRL